MNQEPNALLRSRGINPTAQRLAVARYVLATDAHPSAEQVWAKVNETFPMISRATVYNTLNLFVEKGLLRQFILAEGHAVFDPHMADHHHFVDETTGRIVDLPWESLRVEGVESLGAFAVSEYQVVVRGRRKKFGK